MKKRLPFSSTSKRVFVAYPLLLVVVELLLRGGSPHFNPAGLLLLGWGYAQFKLAGRYRSGLGGGGPGLANPPDRLVTTGIFAYTRNPMYLGLLIYLAGIAVLLRSYAGLALFLLHLPWFQLRVSQDEQRLKEQFGDTYLAYTRRVKRWVPYVY